MIERLLLVVLSFVSCYMVNTHVNSPYMDEYFHVKQAQAYCNGRYDEWDDKITTLPGLYIYTVAIQRALGLRSCSLHNLRCLNYVWIAALAMMVSNVYDRLHLMYSSASVTEILLFPVQLFFYFLFYTDTASTTLVLSMYSASLSDHHVIASLIGVLTILTRQNNIIWVFFAAATCVVRTYERGGYSPSATITKQEYHPQTLEQLPGSVVRLCRVMVTCAPMIIRQCYPYIIVAIGFMSFVHWNNGVVVGDRSSHIAVFHGVQPLYFCAVCMIFQPFTALSNIKGFLTAIWRRPIVTTIIACVFGALVNRYTYAHPFILADNRHVSFYVWKNAFKRHYLLKYAYIPLYMYGAYTIASALLAAKKSMLWCLVYAVCVCMYLIPSALFEFRYFIIPFVMYKLHAPPSNPPWIIQAHVMYNVLVCACVLVVFTLYPFKWPDDTVARFMW